MKKILDAMADRFDRSEYIFSDPVEFPRHFSDPGDREIAAYISSLFAYGGVKAMKSFLASLFASLGDRPLLSLIAGNFRRGNLYYRFQNSDDVDIFLRTLSGMARESGGLPVLERFTGGQELPLEKRIDSLRRAFLDRVPEKKRSRGLVHLIGGPSRSSARKRYCMFLRWAVRSDFPDLGLYQTFQASSLVIPLDRHIAGIARNMGWTKRASADWKTALEITEHLRIFSPADPLKYDFALSRAGILRECRHKFIPELCESCVLRKHCRCYRSARLDTGLASISGRKIPQMIA